jgi:ABC-2 type transport system ATP-binding protein
MTVLKFENIHRAYRRGEDVLRGVSFALDAGEVVGLLGKNGAGKTTLIRIALGLIEAQAGSVRVFGLDPRSDPLEVKSRVGYVSEDQILPPFLRVHQVIDLHRDLFPTWDTSFERELVERFEIKLGEKIKVLSKGQARRVALLCAVCHRPELLLLDEPAGGLDPAARREFLETSIRLLNETGSTILFSSHYMGDVERLASRVVMIQDGGVLIDSALDDLREHYALVLVPHGAENLQQRLMGLKGCIGVRRRHEAMHALFELDPEESRIRVERELDIGGVRSQSVPLEEMFIELMGGAS